MTRASRGSLAALALLAGLVPAGAGADVRLGDLTGERVVLTPEQPAATFEFTLPAGSRQGPRTWWRMHLAYAIRFAPGSGPGYAWVDGDTNGRTAASIEYAVRGRGDGLRFRRVMVDVDGQRVVRRRGRADAVRFTNYLQYEGVRPGRNRWTIRLVQEGGAKVERVEILPGSALRTTRRGPYALTLDAELLDEPPVADEPFRVLVRAFDRQGRPARGTTVDTVTTGPVRRVGVERRADGVLATYVARAPGPVDLGITGTRGERRSAIGLRVDVQAASQGRASTALTAVVLAPGLLGGAWWALRRRRHR